MGDVHAARRARLLAALRERDGALIVPAAPELRVGSDGEVRYVPDPDLYYLTGYGDPGAVLVLCPSADSPFTLFVRERDPDQELWTGTRGGVEGDREAFGADAAFAVGDLASRLGRLVGSAQVLYAPLQSGRPEVDMAVLDVLLAARRTRVRSGRGPHTQADPRLLLGPMRRRKDEHEVALIREAARISVDAFRAAAAAVAGATGEWTIEATLEHGFRAAGAMGPAFPSIVAAGANATVLHYTRNDAPLRAGELVLVDAGARYRMYCADITRTWPVGGALAGGGRALYEVVLAAHDAGIAASRAGSTAADVHDAAVAALVDGMRAVGLVSGSRDEVLERGDYRRYFPHRTSHWLGLDVHDAGDYVDEDGKPAVLEPGMVLTVEPGLYVPAADDAAPAALRGIGIRLEDDVLVTGAGPDVLTAALPIRADDVGLG